MILLMIGLFGLVVYLHSQINLVKSTQLKPDSLAKDTLLAVVDSLANDSLLTRMDSLAVKDSLPDDSLFYSADSIYYFVKDEQIALKGNANVDYKTNKIKSDSINIDFAKDQTSSVGQVWMEDGDQLIIGDEVHYDINSQKGYIIQGASKFEKGYYYGQELRKVDANVFDVDHGIFTTCEGAEPHFYIKTKYMRMYKGDKVVAKPVVFYVNYIPVFGLPFGTFSIKRGRNTGILVPEPGYNKIDGKYIKNIAFYYHYLDMADATIYFDYMEKTGWLTGLQGNYAKRYSYTGNLDASFRKSIYSAKSFRYDWYINERHSQQFGNHTELNANLNFVSSKSIFAGDTDVDKRLMETISSAIDFRKPLFNSTLSATANYSQNLKDNTRTITLPYLSYSLPSKPVYELFIAKNDSLVSKEYWWKDFSYSYSFLGTQYGSINEKNADIWDILYKNKSDSAGTYINQHNAGIRHSWGLRYNYKMWQWLNLTQSLGGNEVWFDRDKKKNMITRGNDYSYNASTNFSIYGSARFQNIPLTAIRHIITPNVGFNYTPDFRKNQRFYSFNGIGLNSGKKARTMNFSLGNKWQFKLKGKDDKEIKINDLISTNSSIYYNLEAKTKKFGNLGHSISLRPGAVKTPLFSVSYDNSTSLSQNPYNFDLENYSYSNNMTLSGEAKYTDYFPVAPNRFVSSKFYTDQDTADVNNAETIDDVEKLAKAGSWNLSLNHSFSKNVKTKFKATDLHTNLTFKLTQSWAITYNNYYDLKTKEMMSQGLTLTRDLHCWRLDFRWTKSVDFWDYRIVLVNVKLPESLKIQTSGRKN